MQYHTREKCVRDEHERSPQLYNTIKRKSEKLRWAASGRYEENDMKKRRMYVVGTCMEWDGCCLVRRRLYYGVTGTRMKHNNVIQTKSVCDFSVVYFEKWCYGQLFAISSPRESTVIRYDDSLELLCLPIVFLHCSPVAISLCIHMDRHGHQHRTHTHTHRGMRSSLEHDLFLCGKQFLLISEGC